MRRLLIVLFPVSLAVAFTVPATAAEWSFYGSARMATYYQDISKEVSPNAYYYGDNNLLWDLQGDSRVGAKVKAGNVSGQFEFGTRVSLRILSGTWNFGAGKILVGRDYTPLDFEFLSNQVFDDDNVLNAFGTLWSRYDMVQLTMGDFKFALVKPVTGDINGLTGADYDTTIPKIEARYDMSFNCLKTGIYGGYNQYDIVGATDKDYGITTYLAGMYGAAVLGPATLNGMFFYGQNLGLSGLPMAANCTPNFDPIHDGIDDNYGYGWAVTLGCKINDILKVEAGYGAVSFKDDVPGAGRDPACSYYLQAVITVAKGFYITPEIGIFDYEHDGAGNDEGDVAYYGIQWRISF
jgi:hypothetical protein